MTKNRAGEASGTGAGSWLGTERGRTVWWKVASKAGYRPEWRECEQGLAGVLRKA